MHNLMEEYGSRAKECIIDPSITEMDGKRMVKVSQWLNESVQKEVRDMGERFESIFENVNYHLKEATKTYHKYK